MIRRMPPALRRYIGELGFLVVSYLFIEAILVSLGMHRVPPGALRLDRFILIVYSMACGFRRVAGYHPMYDISYRRWLELTPWTSRKPLPLGPVALTWGDGLYMATVILLSATQPESRSMQLLCFFLVGHLLALLPTLWMGSAAIGYTTAAGLGLAVRLFYTPAACLAVATFVYLIAYEGLYRSLEKFPWTPRLHGPSKENLTGDPVVECIREVGWPYGPMLAEVREAWRLSRSDAILGCLLLSWWTDCIAALFTDPQGRITFLGFVGLAIVFVPIIRLVLYVRGYAPPLTLWARIRMFKPIVPGYDQVFIGPVCSLVAGPMTVALLSALRAPLEVCFSVAYGMMVLVALLTPPSLRRWRLTGAHRMVPGFVAGQAQGQNQAQSPYVRVG